MRLACGALIAGTILIGCAENGAPAPGANESVATRTEGEITIQTRLTPKAMTVAQTVELTLTLETERPLEVEWPDVAAALEPHFEVASAQSIEREAMPGGVVRQSRRFELQPLLPGEYEIPRLPILLDHDILIETDPVMVTVESVVADAQDQSLAPRKGVTDPPVDVRFWALLSAGIATGALLVTAIVYLLVRQARLRDDAIEQRPAHEVALERLEELLRSDLLTRGEFEPFLNRLSAILRHFIEDRFMIHAPQQTTEEFLAAARSSGALDAARTAELAQFLTRCDLVKFARAEAARSEIDSAVMTVRNFIESSREPDSPARPEDAS